MLRSTLLSRAIRVPGEGLGAPMLVCNIIKGHVNCDARARSLFFQDGHMHVEGGHLSVRSNSAHKLFRVRVADYFNAINDVFPTCCFDLAGIDPWGVKC